MANEFNLRSFQPADGTLLNLLNEATPDGGAIAFYLRYVHDPYETLTALYPGLQGVVAETPGFEGLAGIGFVTLSEGMVEGQVRSLAYMSSLKVHPNFRRRGLAKQLAQWRIEMAREKFNGEGVVFAQIQEGNQASMRAAGSWYNQAYDKRVMSGVTGMRQKPPNPVRGVDVRPARSSDLDEIARKQNDFYRDYNLYPPQSTSRLLSWLDETALGQHLQHYYVALDSQNNIVAGMSLVEDGALMTMHVRRMPIALKIANIFLKLLPKDGVVRRLHVKEFWFVPGQERAARFLWESVQWLAREQGTMMMFFYDTLSPFGPIIPVSKIAPPNISSIVMNSAVPLNLNRPLFQHT